MSRAAEVFAVLQPAADGIEDGNAGLLAEGARLADLLGGSVRTLSWEGGEPGWLEPVVAALAGRLREAEPAIVLLADSDVGRQLAPMVAQRLGTSAVLGCSDVITRDGEVVFVKPVYGGHLEQEIAFTPGFARVVTLQVAPPAATADSAAAPVELISLGAEPVTGGTAAMVAGDPPIRRLELVPPDFRTVDLVHAKRIVSAGAGSVGGDLLAVVAELAELLEGSVGATRPVVDDRRLSKERLIGQTGKTVAPDLYLALGISGSPHHVAGVQGATTIVSVNRDANAPIFQFSDTGYVGDLESVLPALVRRIKEWRDAGGPRASDAASAFDSAGDHDA